jgi:dihydrofolate reductase
MLHTIGIDLGKTVFHCTETRRAPDLHLVADGVESAVAQAKSAARDKAVQVVGSASIAQQLLDAGLVDELHIQIMPVFLGIGPGRLKAPALSASGSRKSTCRKSAREQACDSG